MGRFLQPKCKRCRAIGQKLFLKGNRCNTLKCPLDKKDNIKRKGPPGKSSIYKMKKLSGYGIQLREKQKVKLIYSILERQFRRYFKISTRKKGITGENLIQLLETRLDNIVYRMHFASSRNMARQLIIHGHFEVNGKKIDIPSYNLKAGDVVSLREKSKTVKCILDSLKLVNSQGVVPWLEVDLDNLKGTLKQIPRRNEILDLKDVNEQLIVELYSK